MGKRSQHIKAKARTLRRILNAAPKPKLNKESKAPHSLITKDSLLQTTSKDNKPWFETLPGIITINAIILAVNIPITIWINHTVGIVLIIAFLVVSYWAYQQATKKPKITFLRATSMIFTSIVMPILIGFLLVNTVGKNWDTKYKPELTLNHEPANVVLTNVPNLNFTTVVYNRGNAAAYQIYIHTWITDGNYSGYIDVTKDTIDALQPDEAYDYHVNFPELSFQDYLVYLEIEYSDAPANGRLYSYRYGYEFNKNYLGNIDHMSANQEKRFLSLINNQPTK